MARRLLALSKDSQMITSSSNSTSLQGSLNMTSHASHNVSRGVAKLAVDVVAQSNGGIGMLQSEAGKKYVLLPRLGEHEYNSLCRTAGFSLLTINYCQRGIQLEDFSTWGATAKVSKESSIIAMPGELPGSESVKSLKGLINHDYLVLEVQPGDPAVPIFYIVAQKLSGEEPGIYIEPVLLEKKESVLHAGVLHYSIDCQSKRIPLKTLVEILKEGDPHYSLRNANCWDYATKAAKRLLIECAHWEGNSDEEKKRLKEEHANLEANLASRSIYSTLQLLLLNKVSHFFKST